MSKLRLLSSAGQAAEYLRMEIMKGNIRNIMPGVLRLERELGINRKTVDAALYKLESEGILVGQGAGKRRKIVLPKGAAGVRSLSIGILIGERSDRKVDYIIELRNELEAAGHRVVYPTKCMGELGMELPRIARMVSKTPVDAWVVLAGPRDVLQWFSEQEKPVIALFGRRRGLPIAAVGPDKAPCFATVTRTLIEYGHKRIVLLARPRRRLPAPGAPEQAFLDELAAHEIKVSDYNLPDWEESIDGLYMRLEKLFRVSPPTALIVDEAGVFIAVQQFLAQRQLRVPQEVSLVCTDADPAFDWCHQTIAHIRWDSAPAVRRIVRWIAKVAQGDADMRQTYTPVEFVPGDTIGPVVQVENH